MDSRIAFPRNPTRDHNRFNSMAERSSDADSTTLADLKVSILAATVAGGDELRFGATVIDITSTTSSGEVTAGGTVFRYAIADAGGTRTITFQSLTGAGGSAASAPIADFELLLDGLKYNNASDNPVDGSTRDFSVTVNDGDLDSAPDLVSITIKATSDPPSGADSAVTFAENTAYTVTAADFGFTDPDGDALQSVLLDGFSGLGFLTLNGVAVLAGQEVLVADIDAGRLIYTPPLNASGSGLAGLSFRVRDGGEAGLNLDLTPNTLTFDVTSVNDAPTHDGPLVITTAEDVAITLHTFSVSDVDAGPDDVLTTTITAARGTVSIGDAPAASLTITGTLAEINAILRGGVTYTPQADYAGRTELTISTNDHGATGEGGPQTGISTVFVEVGAVNDAPVVTLAGGPIAVQGTDPVAVNPGLTVTDVDSPALASARVAITDGFVQDQDVLAFTAGAATGDITGVYDADAGVLSLTSVGGHATLAQWQAALRSVTYDFTAASPTGEGRLITFTVNDGQSDSAPVSQALDLDGLTTLDLLERAFAAILRTDPHEANLNPPTALEAAQLPDMAAAIDQGTLSFDDAFGTIAGFADDTTSVATLAYAFFTGKTPTEAGYDYLVHGPANANDLNDPYYAEFNLVNRYINFAVNLGAAGEGKAGFEAGYGGDTLAQAMEAAYTRIFGTAPAAGKIEAILSADVGGMTRAEYLAYYGRDGADGLATKAAGVGFLLATAVLDELGPYDQANDNFLADLADGYALFHVDLIGVYDQPIQTIG